MSELCLYGLQRTVDITSIDILLPVSGKSDESDDRITMLSEYCVMCVCTYRHHCSKSANTPKNLGWLDLPQHCDSLMTSTKFNCHKKDLIEMMYFTGSMSLLTPNHSLKTYGGPEDLTSTTVECTPAIAQRPQHSFKSTRRSAVAKVIDSRQVVMNIRCLKRSTRTTPRQLIKEAIIPGELQQALSQLKAGKAAGPGGITPDPLNHLSSKGSSVLLNILNSSWLSSW